MSFILDALKKSETERQRGDAPGLYEVKMAPPRRSVAPWLIVLASLLVINIVVLSVVLLRGSHAPAPQGEAATVTAPATPAAAMAPTPAPVPEPAPAQPIVLAPPPEAANPPAVAAQDPAPARPSDDDAPAVEAPPRSTGTGTGVQATGGNSGELPTYQQAATAPGSNLPELALNLHSYSNNPAERFIFLNMLKLREGQTTPQGVRVETITPDGAVLSWQGSKFLLQRQ